MRSPGLAAVLIALLACGPGDPQTSATATASTTAATTSATDATGTTGTTGTSAVTTSGQSATDGTTAPATSSTATSDATTTAPATSTGTSSTGGAATETGSDTASTGDTGGGPITCGVADGDYGPCEAELGYVWDGVECTLRSGCTCAPDCDKFFPDEATCALACAADGHCNPDRLEAAGIADDPVLEGSFCDGVYLCPAFPWIQDIFGAIFPMLSCEPGPYPCEQDPVCAGLWQGNLGPNEWLKVCAATLVQNSGPIYCVVFGP